MPSSTTKQNNPYARAMAGFNAMIGATAAVLIISWSLVIADLATSGKPLAMVGIAGAILAMVSGLVFLAAALFTDI